MATAQHNETAIARFMDDIWSKGDMNAIDELVAPDFNFILAFAHMKNREEFKKLVQFNRNVFQGLTYHVDDPENDIVANEKKGSGFWRMTSKHVGTWRNVPASNKDVSIKGLTFFNFNEEGQMVLARVHNDVLGLMRQIGGITEPYATN